MWGQWGQWGLSLRTIFKNLLLPQPNGCELLVDNTLKRRALLNLLLHGAYNAHDAHVRARYTQLLNIPFVREHEYCLFAEVAADGTAASGLCSTFCIFSICGCPESYQLLLCPCSHTTSRLVKMSECSRQTLKTDTNSCSAYANLLPIPISAR